MREAALQRRRSKQNEEGGREAQSRRRNPEREGAIKGGRTLGPWGKGAEMRWLAVKEIPPTRHDAGPFLMLETVGRRALALASPTTSGAY